MQRWQNTTSFLRHMSAMTKCEIVQFYRTSFSHYVIQSFSLKNRERSQGEMFFHAPPDSEGMIEALNRP